VSLVDLAVQHDVLLMGSREGCRNRSTEGGTRDRVTGQRESLELLVARLQELRGYEE
jgi:hypothetical protein